MLRLIFFCLFSLPPEGDATKLQQARVQFGLISNGEVASAEQDYEGSVLETAWSANPHHIRLLFLFFLPLFMQLHVLGQEMPSPEDDSAGSFRDGDPPQHRARGDTDISLMRPAHLRQRRPPQTSFTDHLVRGGHSRSTRLNTTAEVKSLRQCRPHRHPLMSQRNERSWRFLRRLAAPIWSFSGVQHANQPEETAQVVVAGVCVRRGRRSVWVWVVWVWVGVRTSTQRHLSSPRESNIPVLYKQYRETEQVTAGYEEQVEIMSALQVRTAWAVQPQERVHLHAENVGNFPNDLCGVTMLTSYNVPIRRTA